MLEWQPINSGHTFGKNFSGLRELDKWVNKKALKFHKQNDSKVSVLYNTETERVISFYSLKLGQEPIKNTPSEQRQKLAASGLGGFFPCVQLEWLAVAAEFRGQRFGEATLQEALVNCANIFDVSGGYGVVLTPHPDVEDFYEKYGFEPVGSGIAKRMMMPTKVIFDYRNQVQERLDAVVSVTALDAA